MQRLTREQWIVVEQHYRAMSEGAVGERGAAGAGVDAARALDALPDPIRCEVKALLALRETATSFLQADGLQLMQRIDAQARSEMDGISEGEAPIADGDVVGFYRILRLLGRGGMGSVHLAERTLAGVVQQVALKRIARAVHHPELVARFRREQRLLASLDHPGIARLLDVGVDERFGPYLVMEFVDGERLDRYADERRLSLAERIELMARVCEVVHAAHQRLVVHRDLKPANVLVTREGAVKLVDFGISRMLEDTHAEDMLVTAVPALTPAYASPEQLRGAPVSTSADVYSLGVIAHELFCGHLPYRLEDASRRALENAIDRGDALPLGSQFRSLSAEEQRELALHRRSSVASLDRALRGDLESIVSMALMREPSDRYAGAEALADDLRRHLRDEPITARNHRVRELVRKFVRRHRGAVAAAVVAALALTTALVASTWAAFHATRAESRMRDALTKAETETAVALALNDFVVDMLTAPSPMRLDASGRLPRDTRVLDVLADAAQALPALAQQPIAEARVRAFLAMVHAQLGDYEKADELYETAHAIQMRTLGSEDPDALIMIDSRASVLMLLMRATEALPILEQVVEVRQRTLGHSHPLTLVSQNNRAQALTQLGRHEQALPVLRSVVALRRETGTLQSRDGFTTLDNLALALSELGRPEEALEPQREALEGLQALLGSDHPDAIDALGNRAFMLFALGRYEEVAPLYEDVVARWTMRTSTSDPRVLSYSVNLASCYDRLGRIDESAALFGRVIDAIPADGSGEAANRARAMTNLASALRRASRLDESEAAYIEAIQFLTHHMPTGAIAIAGAHAGLGSLLTERKRPIEAIEHLQRSFDALDGAIGVAHLRTQRVIAEMVAAQEAAGRVEDAAKWRARLLPSP